MCECCCIVIGRKGCSYCWHPRCNERDAWAAGLGAPPPIFRCGTSRHAERFCFRRAHTLWRDRSHTAATCWRFGQHLLQCVPMCAVLRAQHETGLMCLWRSRVACALQLTACASWQVRCQPSGSRDRPSPRVHLVLPRLACGMLRQVKGLQWMLWLVRARLPHQPSNSRSRAPPVLLLAPLDELSWGLRLCVLRDQNVSCVGLVCDTQAGTSCCLRVPCVWVVGAFVNLRGVMGSAGWLAAWRGKWCTDM